MIPARAVIGALLLASGIADVAVLDLHLAPRLAMRRAPSQEPPPSAKASFRAPEPAADTAPAAARSASGGAADRAGARIPAEGAASAGSQGSRPAAAPPPKIPALAFGRDSYELTAESASALEKVVHIMKEQPELRIAIRGHSCQLGAWDYNLELSRKRAVAVESFFTERGISRDRIRVEAVGGNEPLDRTPAGLAKNRRVQVVWQ